MWLVVGNFSMLTGSTNAVVADLPWLVVVVVLFGLLAAAWLRSARRPTYQRLGTAHLVTESAAPVAPVAPVVSVAPAAPVTSAAPAPAPAAVAAAEIDVDADLAAAVAAGAVLSMSHGDSGERHA